jgi:hypothetical protein
MRRICEGNLALFASYGRKEETGLSHECDNKEKLLP